MDTHTRRSTTGIHTRGDQQREEVYPHPEVSTGRSLPTPGGINGEKVTHPEVNNGEKVTHPEVNNGPKVGNPHILTVLRWVTLTY